MKLILRIGKKAKKITQKVRLSTGFLCIEKEITGLSNAEIKTFFEEMFPPTLHIYGKEIEAL